jgi:hypothetical protein
MGWKQIPGKDGEGIDKHPLSFPGSRDLQREALPLLDNLSDGAGFGVGLVP